MKQIKPHNSETVVAVVDDEDYDRLNVYRWLVNSKGYIVRYEGLSDDRHQFFLHNEVLNLPPDSGVDHKNECKWDNTKQNLRIVTKSVNQQNRSFNSRNTTGFKGVSFNPSRKYGGKYKASLGVQNKVITIGYFKTAAEAASAYDKRAVETYGPEALTNLKISGLGVGY